VQRGISRPAPVEPEEGGGAAKRQKQRRDGGVAAKLGNGASKEEQASRNKRDRVKDNEEGVGSPKKQRSKCPHQRQRSKCKECGGSSLCPHQRERSKCKECGGSSLCQHQRQRSRCKECGVGGKQPALVVEGEESGGSAKKQRRVKLQATLPPH
jgi:hypothetical protein